MGLQTIAYDNLLEEEQYFIYDYTIQRVVIETDVATSNDPLEITLEVSDWYAARYWLRYSDIHQRFEAKLHIFGPYKRQSLTHMHFEKYVLETKCPYLKNYFPVESGRTELDDETLILYESTLQEQLEEDFYDQITQQVQTNSRRSPGKSFIKNEVPDKYQTDMRMLAFPNFTSAKSITDRIKNGGLSKKKLDALLEAIHERFT